MRAGSISGAGGQFTLDTFARALEVLGPSLQGEMVGVASRGSRAAQAYAVYMFRSQGLGRAIFGKVDAGAYRLIGRLLTQRHSDGSVTSGLKASGLAKLQEAGGRTKAHVIMPKSMRLSKAYVGSRGPSLKSLSSAASRRALGSRGHSGGLDWPKGAVLAFGGRVVRWARHPGSSIHAFPFLERAFERAQPGMARDLEASVLKAMAEKGIA